MKVVIGVCENTIISSAFPHWRAIIHIAFSSTHHFTKQITWNLIYFIAVHENKCMESLLSLINPFGVIQSKSESKIIMQHFWPKTWINKHPTSVINARVISFLVTLLLFTAETIKSKSAPRHQPYVSCLIALIKRGKSLSLSVM